MDRHLLLAAFLGLIVAGITRAQEDQGAKKPAAAVVELLEDGTDFFIEHLDNHGGKDGSVAARDDKTFFSGTSSLSVSSFQRFRVNLPGWTYKITENPQPGEFRYVRFAWKRTEASGILLQFFTRPKTPKGYYAGTVSKVIQQPMISVADEPPRKWELVTRDLYKDFGPITITGINFCAMEGPGVAYYDHIYLGRTIEDLDRVTAAAKKNVLNEPEAEPQAEPPSSKRWLFWGIGLIVLISLAGFLGLAIVLWLRGLKAGEQKTPDRPSAKAGEKPSPAKATGAKTGKPPPKSPEA